MGHFYFALTSTPKALTGSASRMYNIVRFRPGGFSGAVACKKNPASPYAGEGRMFPAGFTAK
ncbi:MAG: hypothetical protein C4557_02780 [Anaerolineaceae bacterium]|nr:MAG: hypothetical protein C4557_02780 [Anaerolineaceae bacterium]